MPIYEYRCERGHTFEVMQSVDDGPLTACSICGAPVQRVFHPVAVHFKGSGFYTTDYGRKKKADSAEATAKSESKDSAKDSGSSDSKGEASSSSSDD
jgi:putative FmdB family regulatory protein